MPKSLIAGYQRCINIGSDKKAEIILHLQNRRQITIPFNNGPDITFMVICQILDNSPEKYYNTAGGGRIEAAGGGILSHVEYALQN